MALAAIRRCQFVAMVLSAIPRACTRRRCSATAAFVGHRPAHQRRRHRHRTMALTPMVITRSPRNLAAPFWARFRRHRRLRAWAPSRSPVVFLESGMHVLQRRDGDDEGHLRPAFTARRPVGELTSAFKALVERVVLAPIGEPMSAQARAAKPTRIASRPRRGRSELIRAGEVVGRAAGCRGRRARLAGYR